MTHKVWVVTHGEQYHDPWLVLGVFSEVATAITYALEEARANEHSRWNMTNVWQFTMNVPGGVPISADQLAQVAISGGSLNLEESAS